MLVFAVILLRSLWGTLAIVIMLVAVLASTIGFTGWTGMKFFGESGAALFVLMAVTVAHSVHVFEGMAAGLRRGLDRKEAAIQSLRVSLWPVFLTSLTTAIGFPSLSFADMPPIRSVGKALLATTVLFGLGFMVFGVSGLVTNQALGLPAGITVVIALPADFLFLPPLLMVLDGTRETSGQIRERLQREAGQPGGLCYPAGKGFGGGARTAAADRRKR